MKQYNIEIDAAVWHHLQRHAEPFVDTPNSILKKLLFAETGAKEQTPAVLSIPSVGIQGLPKSLAKDSILTSDNCVTICGCSFG